jgi:predicted ribosome quality control (RQC) complex YloA/Tae2 family protein
MKFRESKTSSGKILLGGKNAENNEELICQAECDEEIFHTSKPGSPFVAIKSKKPTKKDLQEAAIFCARYSQDWRDNKSNVEVHNFKRKDMFKMEDMKTGTFGVKKFSVINVKKNDILNFIKNQDIKT